MAEIISINMSEKKGTIKYQIKSGMLCKDGGLKGDAHAKDGHRQLSLLAVENFYELEEALGEKIPFGSFAENITTLGIELHTLKLGTKLKVGECVIEITQIGKKCHSDCEIKKKVGKCAMPQKGVFARVITGGKITVGDKITVIK